MATPPGFADCSIAFTLSGFNRESYITFGVDPADTDPLLVAGNILTAVSATASLKTIIDSDVTMTAIHVSLGTDGAEDLSVDYAISIAGTLSAATAPVNCAALIHKRTARGGRRGRGRMFLPWSVSETALDEKGVISSGTVSTMNGAVNTFLTALTTNNVPMVVLHRPGLTTVGGPDRVTSLTVDPVIGTQRRRLGR